MIASVYPITAATSLAGWMNFSFRLARILLHLQKKSRINAYKKDHPGQDRDSHEKRDPKGMQQNPTASNQSNAREQDRPRLAPPGFVIPNRFIGRWIHEFVY